MFDNSPVLQLAPDASLRGVRPVAWFDGKRAAALGLGLGPALPRRRRRRGVEAHGRQGQGLPVRARRSRSAAQPHGTFKFLFNGIYYGTATPQGTAGRQTTTQQGALR